MAGLTQQQCDAIAHTINTGLSHLVVEFNPHLPWRADLLGRNPSEKRPLELSMVPRFEARNGREVLFLQHCPNLGLAEGRIVAEMVLVTHRERIIQLLKYVPVA